MKNYFKRLILLFLLAFLAGCSANSQTEKKVSLFAGSAMKPPLEELARRFEEKTGVRVELNFGGSGALLSQMSISRQGDLYLPASSDFIEKAEKANLIDSRSKKMVAYLIPVLLVREGNPKKIESLSDLARPGIRIALANSDTVVIGQFAQEILEKAAKKDSVLVQRIKENIVTQVGSAEDLLSILFLGQVDVVIGWSVQEKWYPDKLEAVALKPNEIPRIGYVIVAMTKFVRQPRLTRQLLNLIVSSEGKAVFKKYGYIVNKEEADRVLGRQRKDF